MDDISRGDKRVKEDPRRGEEHNNEEERSRRPRVLTEEQRARQRQRDLVLTEKQKVRKRQTSSEYRLSGEQRVRKKQKDSEYELNDEQRARKEAAKLRNTERPACNDGRRQLVCSKAKRKGSGSNLDLDLINQQKKPIKVKFIFTCKFIKENPTTSQIDENSGYFHSNVEIVAESTDFSDSFNTMTNRILELVEQFQNQGSGWQFEQVEYFDINIDPFEPLSGKKHAQRLNKQMRESSEKFNWSGIEFPVSLRQIDKFEKQNPYAINVYGYEGGVYPLRISKKHKAHVINLLLMSNDETNHYCWVKNTSRLLSSQVNNHQHTSIFCCRCLNSFQSKTSLEKHLEYCTKNEEVKIDMPVDEDGDPLHAYFKNYIREMRAPFVVYADFESVTENIDTCSPDEKRSFTKQYQKHKQSGYCYLIKCFDDQIFPPKLVRHTAESPDEDIPQMFVENLESDIKKIYNTFKFSKKVKMSKKDKITYNNATHCHICEGELGEDKIVVGSFTNKEGKQVDVKRDIRFIDSSRFMATSLDSLVDNLTKCGKCELLSEMSSVEDYMKEEPEVEVSSIPKDDEVKRESLAILATLGATKEYVGVNMSLGDISRLPNSDVEKCYNRYQTVLGKQVSSGLVESAIQVASHVISYVVPVDDVEALSKDLQNGELVKRELTNFAGLLVLRGGRLVALASGLFQVAKHIKIAPSEEAPNKIQELTSTTEHTLEHS
ncbi:predicted protein [Nematostella vectensis]|uniref:C2H2-type domain-containing protein n=1 Tax=Nematostella vectensis TaxID=45351 RepID=A7SSJ9_NEMVE|nr:predicted protein [Nematostella vectensis]|eukprot:XP_001625417.1 predicted protein [Nematostella vectensis]